VVYKRQRLRCVPDSPILGVRVTRFAVCRWTVPEHSAWSSYIPRVSDGEGCAVPVERHSGAARLVNSLSGLDAQPSRLFGRENDLAAIRSLLLADEVRLLTLTGPGGVGKTRLVLEVGGEAHPHFAHGVVFIDLTPVRDPEEVLPAVGKGLGFRDLEGSVLLERLQTYLAQRELLLILDNVEQVLPAITQLAGLLVAGPRVKLLTTSREPLHLRFEQIFHVLPLALPDPEHLPPLEELSQIPSSALFLHRAQAMNPDFTLTGGECSGSRRVGGAPGWVASGDRAGCGPH